jgi:protein gp37
MAAATKIEWSEFSWNPVTGCSKLSSGCKNCYAERMANRLQAMGNKRYINGFSVTLHEDLLEYPLSIKSSKLIFVNSMSDLFHEDVPFSFIEKIFYVMNQSEQHIFQILTKRSERLLELSSRLNWTENIWMGVTVEDESQKRRVTDLSGVPAKVRFLSCEPLLSEISNLDLHGIHWVIVGGESGPHARSVKEEWVSSIHSQCCYFSVPFFFKQWGGTRKKKNGRLLNNRVFDEMPLCFLPA